MAKLSPHYRDDQVDGLPEDVKGYLDKHFLRGLPNLQATNPKLLVVFSGANAVGKSVLSQRIGQELTGLVLENDQVKCHLLAYLPNLDRDNLNALTWKYTMNLYAQLAEVTANGLVVRDGLIDWYYDRVLPVFERQGYPLFIISYDIPLDKRIKLIKRRGDTATTDAARLIKILEDHDVHTGRFRQQFTPDITLDETNLFDHERVIAALKAKLASLKSGA